MPTQTAYKRNRHPAKYRRKDMRTLVLSQVFGSQSGTSSDILPGNSLLTEELCQSKEGFSTQRKAVVKLLVCCAWPTEKTQAILQAFDQRYSLKQGSGS
jgi:hypothetical protein